MPVSFCILSLALKADSRIYQLFLDSSVLVLVPFCFILAATASPLFGDVQDFSYFQQILSRIAPYARVEACRQQFLTALGMS